MTKQLDSSSLSGQGERSDEQRHESRGGVAEVGSALRGGQGDCRRASVVTVLGVLCGPGSAARFLVDHVADGLVDAHFAGGARGVRLCYGSDLRAGVASGRVFEVEDRVGRDKGLARNAVQSYLHRGEGSEYTHSQL